MIGTGRGPRGAVVRQWSGNGGLLGRVSVKAAFRLITTGRKLVHRTVSGPPWSLLKQPSYVPTAHPIPNDSKLDFTRAMDILADLVVTLLCKITQPGYTGTMSEAYHVWK